MPSSFPVIQPESPEAQAILDLFVMVLWISAGIFAIVATLILIAILRGREKKDLPEQVFGDRRREISWMVGPIIILLWIGAISAKLILTLNAYPEVDFAYESESPAELTIVGHQWWWEVRYNGTQVVGANEVHIPIGKKLRVEVTAADVIHSFWVPQLARKMDAIPGRENYIWLEASRPGTFQGRCAEFCGNQHAWMNFKVYAHEPAEYERWLAEEAIVPAKPTSEEAIAGEKLFFSQTCVNCHTISGTAAEVRIGPNLTHLVRRKELGGGVLENTPENLRRWLKDPHQFKPACFMPDFQFSDEEVNQLATYLEGLH